MKEKGDYIKILHHDEWFMLGFAIHIYLMFVLKNTDSLIVSTSKLVRNGIQSEFRANETTIRIINKEPRYIVIGNQLEFRKEQLHLEDYDLWIQIFAL